MDASMDEFVITVCMNLWLRFNSMQLFPNIKWKIPWIWHLET